MKKSRKILSKLFMRAIMIFFYMPIVYTIVFSFNSNKVTYPLERIFAAVV